MAQKQRNRVKEVLFFAFLAISLVLVVLVWTEGLRADSEEGSRYFGNSTSLEGDAPWASPTGLPATPGMDASEEAPGGHPGTHRQSPPTSTPRGRSLDAEEM
jgi:hypothetical protein